MWTWYRWCGMSICAGFELPELPCLEPAEADAARWRVTLEDGSAPERPHRVWFHQWAFPDGRPWVAFSRDESGYLLRFPDLGDFDVVPSARTIGCYAHPATPIHTLRHLLLDQVLPLLAGGRDGLALHGSAVAGADGALVFLGDPGSGKSTLAAKLARHGLHLVSDDCCLLVRTPSGFDVVPSYAGVRLAPDSIREVFADSPDLYARVAHYTAKLRVAGDRRPDLRHRDARLPLARVYVLPSTEQTEATSPAIARRGRRAALFDLLNYTFHLDVGDPVRIGEAFGLAADIAQQYDVRTLLLPKDLSKLDAVAGVVLGDR